MRVSNSREPLHQPNNSPLAHDDRTFVLIIAIVLAALAMGLCTAATASLVCPPQRASACCDEAR